MQESSGAKRQALSDKTLTSSVMDVLPVIVGAGLAIDQSTKAARQDPMLPFTVVRSVAELRVWRLRNRVTHHSTCNRKRICFFNVLFSFILVNIYIQLYSTTIQHFKSLFN